MLSMAPDLVLNLIYGNAACSTYEQKERPEQPERERQRPGRRQKVRHTWVKLAEQQQQQRQKKGAGVGPEAGRMVSNR